MNSTIFINNRNKTYDYMKAFAIFLVVMDHTISNTDGIDNGFRVFIYSVHMPLFFIVSGFLASKRHQTMVEWLKFYRKKTRLLIPFLAFSIADCLLLNRSFDEYLGWNKFGLWFLWTLFLFFTIYSFSQVLIIRIFKKYVDIFVLFLTSCLLFALRKYSDTYLGGIFNFLNMYNYVFFVIGVIINRYNLKRIVLRDDIQFVLLAIYVVALSIGHPILNIPMKACGILFLYGCFEKITSKPLPFSGGGTIDKLICQVGSNSLYIYIIHFYMIYGIKQLPEYIHSFIFMTSAFYLPFFSLLSCFLIIICIIIKAIVCQNKYVRILIFGEKN